MRGAWVALLPMAVAGCVPPTVAVVSYAADGASYVASGKSVSDHGVSVVANKDCATWHFFVGRAVCEDPKHPVPTAPLEVHNGTRQPLPTVVADHQPVTVDPASAPPVLVSASSAQPAPAALLDNPPGGYQPAALEASYSPPLPSVVADDHYVAVGTFSDRRRAELYVRRYAEFHPRILPTSFAGRDLLRVVLGPLDDGQLERLRALGAPVYVVRGPFPDTPAVARSPAPGVSG